MSTVPYFFLFLRSLLFFPRHTCFPSSFSVSLLSHILSHSPTTVLPLPYYFHFLSLLSCFLSPPKLEFSLGTRVEWNHDTTLMCICPCTCSSSALIIVATVVFPACVSVATKDTINHGLRTSESLSELISRPNLCVDHSVVLQYEVCEREISRTRTHEDTSDSYRLMASAKM